MKAIHGIMAEYATSEAFLDGLRRARQRGYARIEAYAPYPVEGMDELVPGRPSPIGWIMFAAGLAGAAGAFGLQAYASADYPLNVGGRPIFSWPAFIPITFEVTVLAAALAGLAAFLGFARFPRLDHAVFADDRFHRASQDRFFVCIRADDPRYERESVTSLLQAAGAESVQEVLA